MSFITSETLKKGLFVSGHALISVLMLLQSLAIQISIPETVLCIGDDGHIMVEREGIDIHCEYPIGMCPLATGKLPTSCQLVHLTCQPHLQ